MATFAGGNPVLLIKKLAGVFLLILGLVLAATGLSQSYDGLTVIGTLVLVTGIVLLIMKIVRRNQPTN
jgi:uncharacterized membrane protein HdeD (DUF308 family)